MARLNAWLLPVYVLVGLIAVVVILPASRWIVLNQLDVLEGRWRVDALMNGIAPNIKRMAPIERGTVKGDLDPDATAQFLFACSAESDSPPADFSNLFTDCGRNNDARYWATFIRLDAFRATIPTGPGTPPKSDRDLAMVESACRAGAKKDPDNAFFPMILAGVLSRQGKENEARTTLIRAGNCSKFDDYCMFEAETRFRYAVDNYGYRGDQTRALMIAQTPLPQLNALRSVGLHFSDPKNVEACYAVAWLGDLMVRQSSTLFGVIVGGRIVTFAIAPKSRTNDLKLSVEEAGRLAKQLQQRAHSAVDLSPSAAIAVESATNYRGFDVLTGRSYSILNLDPAYSAAALLGLLLLPFAFGAMWLKTESKRLAQATPYLAWLAALAIDQAFFPHGGYNFDGAMFGSAALLFVPALFDKCRKATDVVGVFVGLAGLGAGLYCGPLFPISAFFLGSLIVERRVARPPAWLTAAFIVLGCIIASAFWIACDIQLGMGDGIAFGGLAAVAMFSQIPVRDLGRWQPVVGICCAVVAVWFGATVYRDIAANKTMIAVANDLEHSGDWTRAQLGIVHVKPDRRDPELRPLQGRN